MYAGTSRLLFNGEGRICDHRDHFAVVGPTIGPVPLPGSFVHWLCKRCVG